jgi:hypothetical protein
MLDLSGLDDRERLLDMAYRVGADLVVIDSYGASTLKGENAKEDVQANLAFLSRMALDYECAVLILHHLRKRSSLHVSLPRIPMTIDSIRGSSHIPAMARNVLGMQWVERGMGADRNGPRRLEVIKSNLERYPPALGVWFEPHPEDGSVARLRFGEAPEPERVETTTEQCAAWLLELLQTQGPLPASEVVALGTVAGYSERTIYRARRQLGDEVTNTRGWRDPGNTWAVAGGEEGEQTSDAEGRPPRSCASECEPDLGGL